MQILRDNKAPGSMKKLFRIFLLYIMVFCILPAMNVNAGQTQTSLSEEIGSAFINVRTPKNFDETVYLQLMNEEGGRKTYSISSESDYMIEEMIPVGTYRVIGRVDEDLISAYVVEACTAMVTISSDADAFIELSVVPNSDITSESESDLNSAPDNADNTSDSDPNLSDNDDSDISADVSENEPSLVGPLVTALAAIIIIICIAIFIGFIYRYRNE